jgi:hypothetical protein
MRFIRFVGRDKCTSSKYQKGIASRQGVVVDRVSLAPNSAVHFLLDGKPLAPGIRGEALDLFDLGVLVYLVDEMIDRSQEKDYWTRTIPCLLPVNNSRIWRRNDPVLRETLRRLSGDLWGFEWLPLNNPPSEKTHRKGLPRDCDTVCLFSGGTDSLLGAIRLLDVGRQVLLVGHQAESQTASLDSHESIFA